MNFSCEPANPKRIISAVNKIAVYILATLLTLAGCQKQQAEPFDSRPQQTVKAEPETKQAAQFEITINIVTVDKNEYAALDQVWKNAIRGILMSPQPEILDESQLKIGMAWSGFAEKLDAIKQKLSTVEESEFTVTASESQPAYLEIGKAVAVEKFFYYGRWYNADEYNFASAVRLLKIVPRLIPDRDLLNLNLTPVISGLLANGEDMEFVKAKAGLTLKPMQQGVVGAPAGWDNYLATALLCSKQDDKDKQSIILIKVRRL